MMASILKIRSSDPRSVAAGGLTHADVTVDLGHLAVRLAVSVRQAHLYCSLRCGKRNAARDTQSAGAERGDRSTQQVDDVVKDRQHQIAQLRRLQQGCKWRARMLPR